MRYLILLSLLFSTHLSAESYQPRDAAEIRAQYNLLVELRNNDEITRDVFVEQTDRLKQLAADKHGIDIKSLQLQALVPIKKFDWIGTALYVVSAVLVLALLAPLLAQLFIPLNQFLNRLVDYFKNSRLFMLIARKLAIFFRKIWEVLAYILLGVTVYLVGHEYVVLLVSFILGALICYSVMSRKSEKNKERYFKFTAGLLFLVWAGLAVYFENNIVGFLAVVAFTGFVFSIFLVVPKVIYADRNVPKAILKSSVVFFTLALFSCALFYTEYLPFSARVISLVDVFQLGMVVLFTLAYFSSAFYWVVTQDYRKKFFTLVAELMLSVSGFVLLIISLLLEINHMFWLSLLFVAGDIAYKYCKYIYKQLDHLSAGLILASLLGAAGYLIKSNMLVIMQTLEPLYL